MTPGRGEAGTVMAVWHAMAVGRAMVGALGGLVAVPSGWAQNDSPDTRLALRDDGAAGTICSGLRRPSPCGYPGEQQASTVRTIEAVALWPLTLDGSRAIECLFLSLESDASLGCAVPRRHTSGPPTRGMTGRPPQFHPWWDCRHPPNRLEIEQAFYSGSPGRSP